MTPENYLWYSKAVLLSIATLTFLGVFLRWKTESRICRPLAYMSLLLAVVCIVDIVVCQKFDYHPLMIKSGSSFGVLVLVLVIISFSYLYAIQLFHPVKVTVKLLLRLNACLIVSLIGYVILSIANIDYIPNYNIHQLIGHLENNTFAVWWLLTTLSVVVYAIFVNLQTLGWTLIHIRSTPKEHSFVGHLTRYGLFVPYLLFSFGIFVLLCFSCCDMQPGVEACCFIALSVILFLIYIYSQFYSFCLDKREKEVLVDSEVVAEKQLIRANDRLLIEKITHLMEVEELYKSTDLTTEVLAGQLGISRKKLYLFLKEHYDSTFSEYLNSIRLECAEKLMAGKENINLSIAQISEMSGFNSVKTFNKFFKEKHAITPTKYRNSIDF